MAAESIRHVFSIDFVSPWVIASLFLASILFIPLLSALYNIYLHPLSAYPGPRFWSATHIPWIYNRLTGRLVWKSIDLHRSYGSVVRVAPNQLSYTTESAWKSIYGLRPVEMQKNVLAGFSKPGLKDAHGILSADKPNHTRLRRVLGPAFSERSIKEQDGCVIKYADLLMRKLHARAGEGPLDVNGYFTWVTLDLIGDLICGQPAKALENEDGGQWLDILTNSIQSQVWLQAIDFYGLTKWRQYLLPTSKANAAIDNFRILSSKIDARLASPAPRKDFLSYVLSSRDQNSISPLELRLNCATIIGAGTGTTTTWLSSTVHSLTCTPSVYAALTREIRSTFNSDEEITSEAVTKLPYLAAVMQEGLRIHSPSPSSLGRFVPKGGELIDGRFVPGGTTVGVHQHAAYHLVENFHRPDDFCPERWLKEGREKDSPFRNDSLGVVQPFSHGPRTCLGIKLTYAETRIILAKLFWYFDLELLPEFVNWQSSQQGTVAWHRTPLKCKLTPVQKE